MFINIILLVVGFVILIKGADWFVDGASAVAGNFKISKMLIGLTIVAFGTSAPEFAVSIKSLISGSGDIVLGNVVGSNIFNILLILGISACVHTLTVKNNTVKKELPITLLMSTLLVALLSDNLFDKNITNNMFTRGDGFVLLLVFLVFVYYLISIVRNKTEDEVEENLMKLPKAIFLTVVGITGIVLGSNFVVDSATYIAGALGVSERMIGLTIIAMGTSLPELVTSVIATKKGEYDIAIGNVVGSNIFNIGIVIGLPVLLFGTIPNVTYNIIDLAVMLASAALLFVFSYNDYKIKKDEGILFIIMFVIYYSYGFNYRIC